MGQLLLDVILTGWHPPRTSPLFRELSQSFFTNSFLRSLHSNFLLSLSFSVSFFPTLVSFIYPFLNLFLSAPLFQSLCLVLSISQPRSFNLSASFFQSLCLVLSISLLLSLNFFLKTSLLLCLSKYLLLFLYHYVSQSLPLSVLVCQSPNLPSIYYVYVYCRFQLLTVQCSAENLSPFTGFIFAKKSSLRMNYRTHINEARVAQLVER